MGILEGKKVLVTGVLTEASIAFATARLAAELCRRHGDCRSERRVIARRSASWRSPPRTRGASTRKWARSISRASAIS